MKFKQFKVLGLLGAISLGMAIPSLTSAQTPLDNFSNVIRIGIVMPNNKANDIEIKSDSSAMVEREMNPLNLPILARSSSQSMSNNMVNDKYDLSHMEKYSMVINMDKHSEAQLVQGYKDAVKDKVDARVMESAKGLIVTYGTPEDFHKLSVTFPENGKKNPYYSVELVRKLKKDFDLAKK